MEISILCAESTDIQEINQLANIIWHAHYPGIITVEQIDYMMNMMYSEQVIAKEIKNGIQWDVIVADNKKIGFIAHHVDRKTGTYKLSKLYVLPEFHGKGIGRTGLEHVINCARAAKMKEVYLTVNKKNTKAISSYEKFGFVVTELVCNEIGNGYVMDDFIMTFFL